VDVLLDILRVTAIVVVLCVSMALLVGVMAIIGQGLAGPPLPPTQSSPGGFPVVTAASPPDGPMRTVADVRAQYVEGHFRIDARDK